MENGSPIAPSGGEVAAPVAPVAPTPAAPVAPVAPAPAPTAPQSPIQPAAPAQPTATQPTAEELDAAEWDKAEDAVFPGLKSVNKTESKDEPAKPAQTAEKPKTVEAPAAPQAGDEVQGHGDDAAAQNAIEAAAKTEPGNSAREARVASRELAQQQEVMRTDVRTKMYPDMPDTLVDADGDPITSLGDVMNLIDPATITAENPSGTNFTPEAAAAWFVEARRQFEASKAESTERVNQIADLNIRIKDEIDMVNEKFGDYLKAHTDVRDRLWARFSGSMATDPKTKIFTSMPMSLYDYYEDALTPLVAADAAAPVVAAPVAPVAPGTPEQTPEQKLAADQEAAAQAQRDKQQHRADRSTIYQPTNTPVTDPDEAEWDKAHEKVFGPQVKK